MLNVVDGKNAKVQEEGDYLQLSLNVSKGNKN